MPAIAFLSMKSLAGYECDDPLTYEPLAQLGIQMESVPWDEPSDWKRFEAVIVRSPWDYQKRFEEFRSVLRTINRSGTALWNPLALMEWNLHKSYLLELESRGVPIVPTRRGSHLTHQDLQQLPDQLGTEQIIIKPIVGAGAHRTHRLKFPLTADQTENVLRDHQESEYLAQPFLNSIITEGEYSLIYFGGRFSHAIRKTPRAGDFRSQEEFGSQLVAIEPDPCLTEHADRIIAVLTPQPLYARVDLIRFQDGFALMEVELVEPALYLSKCPAAAQRFAAAIAHMLTQLK